MRVHGRKEGGGVTKLGDVKAFLVWNDGTRQPFSWIGEHTRIVTTSHPDGKTSETMFRVGDGDIAADGTLLFIEGESRDVTKEMEDARARIEERRWQVIRRGLGWS